VGGLPVAVSARAITPPTSSLVGPKNAPLTLVVGDLPRAESVDDVTPIVPPLNVLAAMVESVIVTVTTVVNERVYLDKYSRCSRNDGTRLRKRVRSSRVWSFGENEVGQVYYIGLMTWGWTALVVAGG
jgi:hypothetical protein